jgi:hypothetical protein
MQYDAGMTGFTKIAVTVPTATYTVIERLRRRMGKSRSAVVALALEEWIRAADISDDDRRYAEAYVRIPESPAALAEIRALAAQAASHWQTWEPGAPLRAAGSRRSSPPPAKKRPRSRR